MPRGSVFCLCWHTFLRLLLGALFSRFLAFRGDFRLTFAVKRGPRINFRSIEKMMQEKGMQQFSRILRKGRFHIITSGLELSWVLVPFGACSLERGQGQSCWELVTPVAFSNPSSLSHCFHFCGQLRSFLSHSFLWQGPLCSLSFVFLRLLYIA